jgi:hypothetical protein
VHLCSGWCTLVNMRHDIYIDIYINTFLWSNISPMGDGYETCHMHETLKYCSCSLSEKILTRLLLFLQLFLLHFTLVLTQYLFSMRGFDCGIFWNGVLISCDCRSPIKTASSFHPIIHLCMCTHIKKTQEPLEVLASNLILGNFTDMRWYIPLLLKLDEMTDT